MTRALEAPPRRPARRRRGRCGSLGTYRDIWASEVTERNPSLRFLKPAQRIELAEEDAERLGVEHGQPVTVSVNGTSVTARAAIRSTIDPGRRVPDRGDRRGERKRAGQRRAAGRRGEAGE